MHAAHAYGQIFENNMLALLTQVLNIDTQNTALKLLQDKDFGFYFLSGALEWG